MRFFFIDPVKEMAKIKEKSYCKRQHIMCEMESFIKEMEAAIEKRRNTKQNNKKRNGISNPAAADHA